jgi:hypothetical protein
MRNLKASRLDTFAELEALPGTKMISATRRIFYMRSLKASRFFKGFGRTKVHSGGEMLLPGAN